MHISTTNLTRSLRRGSTVGHSSYSRCAAVQGFLAVCKQHYFLAINGEKKFLLFLIWRGEMLSLGTLRKLQRRTTRWWLTGGSWRIGVIWQMTHRWVTTHKNRDYKKCCRSGRVKRTQSSAFWPYVQSLHVPCNMVQEAKEERTNMRDEFSIWPRQQLLSRCKLARSLVQQTECKFATEGD